MKADTKSLTRGDKSLSDYSQEYRELIRAEMNEQIKQEKRRNDRWTGVVSTAHFTTAGCHVSHLTEGIDDWPAHMTVLGVFVIILGLFLANKGLEMRMDDKGSAMQDLDYRHKLGGFGKKVLKLKAQATKHSAAIGSAGNAAKTARKLDLD